MQKILVVVDMQKDFIDGALGTKEAMAIVENVVSKINGFDGKIFVTLDTHNDKYLDTLEGKMLQIPHCIRMTDGWILNQDVRNSLANKDYKIIEKWTFGSTRLANEIRKVKINDETKVEVIGLCSDICVVSNAILLRSYFPNLKITVDASCCAGSTPEKHIEALSIMRSCQINVVNF